MTAERSEVSKHLAAHGLEALAREIESLSPPDRLRLAADLLERKRPRLSLAIAARVVAELELVAGLAP